MQAGQQPAFPRSAGSAPVAHEIKILRELPWCLLAFGSWEGPLMDSPGMIGSDHWLTELASDLTAMQPQPRAHYCLHLRTWLPSITSREM
jgi:hypothetical protein